MRQFVAAALVSLIAGAGVAGQPRPVSSQVIAGVVFDTRDNAPLRRARVATVAGSREERAAYTGDDGRFMLTQLPAAPVTVRITKAGYAAAQLIVSPQAAGADVRIALARGVAVNGRVTDAMGAVRSAYVAASLLLPDGTPAPAASGRFYAQTDRLGEYRLGSLPAGRYSITGLRRPGGALPPGTAGDQLFGSREGFDVGRTAILTLAPGEEAGGIDFTVPGTTEACATGPSVLPADGEVAARIEGRVTSRSGEPVPCASVRIVVPSAPVPQVYTDADGWYAIDGLPAGTFLLTASRPGFIPLRFGQRDPSEDETPITLGRGERREGVDFTLPRESILAGAVVDEHGEPMEGVPMTALRVWRTTGRPFFLPIPVAVTDDRGRYRIAGVPPGEYVVSARASGQVSSMARSSGYTSMYHPGTPDIAAALRVPVVAGRDVDGIDVVVRSVFTGTMSGTVVDASGRPFTGSIVLSASARSGAIPLDSRTAQTDASGSFVLRDVPRGDYVLKAPGSVLNEWGQFGMQYVSVREDDPPPVRLSLADGARVEGRFVTEASPDANLAGMTVSFLPAEPDYTPVGGFKAPIFGREPDSTFRMGGLVGPARITLPPMPACATCYLKSAIVNGTDSVDAPFDFGTKGGLYRDVEVVVSDAGPTIEGRVLDNRAPLSAYAVIVMSAHEELRFEGSRYTRVGSRLPDGSFRVTGLPPGDYLIAAVKRTEGSINVAEVSDDDVLALAAARGTRLTLAERERRTIDLTLLRR